MDLLTELLETIKTMEPSEITALLNTPAHSKAKKVRGRNRAIRGARAHLVLLGNLKKAHAATKLKRVSKKLQETEARLQAMIASPKQDSPVAAALSKSEQYQVDRILSNRTHLSAADRLEAIECVIADRAVGAMVCHGGDLRTL